MAQVSEQLIDDHAAIERVLKQLQGALRFSDVETAHGKLDLFWARLAVHIRAEHLHLFPTVLSKVENAAVGHASAPSLEEAQSVVAQLREDHDFFMHELALAVEIMRELLTLPRQFIAPAGLNNVERIVLEVEERLIKHNELEENQIYHWTTILLNPEEQAKLANQIASELLKHPPRFTPSTWLDE
jgi:hypothetical protein